MGGCYWYLRGGAWRSRRRDILGVCIGFVIVFGGGGDPQHIFCSPRELGIPPHGKKEAARTVAYIIFFVGAFS